MWEWRIPIEHAALADLEFGEKGTFVVDDRGFFKSIKNPPFFIIAVFSNFRTGN
jgi:hypothetical protein